MNLLRSWLPPLHIALVGLYFGALQWGAFFLLQSYLASTAVVYLLATAAWMTGSIIGLVVPGQGHERLWLFASAAGYATLHMLATAHAYELGWLPILLLCVAAMGGYAGRFFRFRASATEDGHESATSRLFALENTGFVAGMAATVALLFWFGDRTLLALPFGAATLAFLTVPAEPAPAGAHSRAAAPIP